LLAEGATPESIVAFTFTDGALSSCSRGSATHNCNPCKRRAGRGERSRQREAQRRCICICAHFFRIFPRFVGVLGRDGGYPKRATMRAKILTLR
jgi:hypothetical protein